MPRSAPMPKLVPEDRKVPLTKHLLRDLRVGSLYLQKPRKQRIRNPLEKPNLLQRSNRLLSNVDPADRGSTLFRNPTPAHLAREGDLQKASLSLPSLPSRHQRSEEGQGRILFQSHRYLCRRSVHRLRLDHNQLSEVQGGRRKVPTKKGPVRPHRKRQRRRSVPKRNLARRHRLSRKRKILRHMTLSERLLKRVEAAGR